MEKVQGIVQQVSNKEKAYGIKVNDVWYNGWNKSPVNKGDEVEVEFVINGTFKNVQKVTLLKGAPEEKSNKTTSMYVSYAKDLMCVALERIDSTVTLSTDDMNHLIDESVRIIKRAKQAFENDMPEVQEEEKTNQA